MRLGFALQPVRRAILARRAEGQSLREIARGVGVSLAVVHAEVKAAETGT
ncbi:helix-turn-helix domain-containing protein [Sphaerisporangium fuscum]|nr:helix-turn-helix domain-containing protein [Sphaerisporangium fuscum]